ncbi:MAG: hypothetical protein IJ086_09525 [Clostridium sp.]|jgi:hypothetical protein|uniref:Uncharacterized protein n=2 Tax=Clostridium TaxID=1485 RepID=A0ABS2FK06_9CLOT|nr:MULTISPECIES: hypothetical protein [Clostridiaceae]MBM6820218.1 hypothetical protein [Clostridium saudiense]MBQ8998908.1 hypothetical protein [Clostridium sp.]
MKKRTKQILFVIIIVLILIIGVIVLNLYNKGFKFYTYTTENYITEQIEGIIGIDDGKNYSGKIEELSIKEMDDSYLGFFCIKDNNENQCVIAKYKECFNLGSHIVLNLDKIIKGSNSVTMVELSEENNNDFLILISKDEDKYESLNIVSMNNEEILDNIILTDEGIKEFGGELLKDNIYLLQYKADAYKEIGIELVKKSEE